MLAALTLSVQHVNKLSSIQSICRLKSRVRAVEIAAAKARTNFIPEGPLAEEQEAKGPDAYNAAPHNFKRQRTSKAYSNQEYWDCYFHRNQRASQPQPAHQTCDTDEEEDGNDQDPFSSCDQGSDPDSDCIDLDSDEEAEQECAGQQHQQHPQSFYKQPPCLMSVTSAFQQLVNFVKQLPQRVKDDKAAAHLKTFESRKVQSLCQPTQQFCAAMPCRPKPSGFEISDFNKHVSLACSCRHRQHVSLRECHPQYAMCALTCLKATTSVGFRGLELI